MKILIDKCLPRKLKRELSDHEVKTVPEAGWAGTQNGALLRLMAGVFDALYFHLYHIAREDVDYIMDTFPIVRRKDEDQHGDYRTKRTEFITDNLILWE
ncbi:MAG: hypothetical protein K8I82_12410 [Anaerolineae bacterium]|nr:hypothetical protein [Anaerolineae bacterium]